MLLRRSSPPALPAGAAAAPPGWAACLHNEGAKGRKRLPRAVVQTAVALHAAPRMRGQAEKCNQTIPQPATAPAHLWGWLAAPPCPAAPLPAAPAAAAERGPRHRCRCRRRCHRPPSQSALPHSAAALWPALPPRAAAAPCPWPAWSRGGGGTRRKWTEATAGELPHVQNWQWLGVERHMQLGHHGTLESCVPTCSGSSLARLAALYCCLNAALASSRALFFRYLRLTCLGRRVNVAIRSSGGGQLASRQWRHITINGTRGCRCLLGQTKQLGSTASHIPCPPRCPGSTWQAPGPRDGQRSGCAPCSKRQQRRRQRSGRGGGCVLATGTQLRHVFGFTCALRQASHHSPEGGGAALRAHAPLPACLDRARAVGPRCRCYCMC